MKLLSWNVNWLRAVVKKWFMDFLKNENPDILGLQEIKVQPDQLDQFFLDELCNFWYNVFLNSAKRKWYSWTAIFTKKQPLNIIKWIKLEEDLTIKYPEFSKEIEKVIYQDKEWRVLTAEFEDFFFTTVYTPNAKPDLSRLKFRQIWDEAFLKYMKKLDETKPVIFCWDLNVAHKEIDLKNPKANEWHHGFTIEERQWFSHFLENWFIDTFRYFYPDKTWAYSWWSYFWNARKNNSWWRIDYFLISEKLIDRLQDAFILPDITGSDHCPVWITIREVE